MEPATLNDEFLRRLRPTPRAAFVHELKAKLNRLPRRRQFVGGPAYLRTLLVALLIGGAAFAVTMMSTRREQPARQANASGAQAPRPVAAVTEIAPPPPVPPVEAKKDELTPAIVRAVRRDPGPIIIEVAGAAQERQVDRASASTGASQSGQSGATQAVSGIALAGPALGSIDGAGAVFPSAIYTAWGMQYRRATGVSVDYQALGSGRALKLLEENAFAFAAVDVPLSAEELRIYRLMQFPALVGAVVPVVHLLGLPASEIVLDGPTLARIYLGEIQLWSDPQIRKLNPRLPLPNTRITVVFRSDSSATTYLFTEYLSKSAPWFRGRYGATMQIDVSPGVAARGNDGVMEAIERTSGSIGYVDYLYAQQKGVSSIRLVNKVGNMVAATPESLQSAVVHADWGAPSLGASLADLPGQETWPIAGASFIVVPTKVNRAATSTTFQFFDWAYRNGSKQAEEMDYVTIPPTVANRVRAAWAATMGGAPADYERK